MEEVLKDLRYWLECFRKEQNELIVISREVDPKFELAAIAKQIDVGPAVLFENVKGSKIPVLVGLYSTRKRVSRILGADLSRLTFIFEKGLDNRKKPILAQNSSAREIFIDENIDLLKTLPILWSTPKDAGWYITAGVVLAKDPETGQRNASIHRLQVIDKDRFAICIAKGLGRHLERFFEKAEAKGHPLEVTISIGVEPSVFFGACLNEPLIALGEDEMEIAGGIKGQPIELVAGEKVNVEAFAQSEIILEGEIVPNVRVMEGPFLDSANTYDRPEERPVVRVRSISHRKSPIYQAIVGSSSEHVMPGSLVREMSVFKVVSRVIPSVKDVFLTPGGCSRLNLIIRMKKEVEGQQRNALIAALSAHHYIKHVVVVDEDIDIYNPHDVEWAIATRFQGHKDLIIIPNTIGPAIDPSSIEGRTTRVGVDATKPLVRSGEFDKGEFLKVNLKDYLD